MKNKTNELLNIIIVAVVIIVSAGSIFLLSPPKPLPYDAPLASFSAERAMDHVREMCQNSHWIGTDANRRVRDYIIREMKNLGLETQIQTSTAFNYYRRFYVARVENIIAVLKGTHYGKTVLITGHYDSQPFTPGAADDGSAVAAMLETARALKNSPPLKNDIIFLFTDGEEVGMAGAKAFVDENPLMKNVGIVFNLEARGNSGPSFTFETSNENGWIIKEYSKAVPYPFAGSVMFEVYKSMPNNTDFTIFKEAGAAGFNAAMIDGLVNYHSMTDIPENLNKGSLQHHGSYILGIAKHFGNIPILQTKERNEVFFNPIGSWFIHYPGYLNLPFLILVFILYILYLFIGIKKKQLTPKGIIGGFLIYLSSVIAILIVTWLAQKGIKSLYPNYSHFDYNSFYNVHFYFILFTMLTIGLFSVLYFFLFSKLKTENLAAGAQTVFVIIMVALYMKMPTAAYLFIYPLFFTLMAGILIGIIDLTKEQKYNYYTILQLLAVLPAIALYAPIVKLLYISFGLSMAYSGVALLSILLGFLIPQLKVDYNISRYALPIAAILVGVVAFIGGHLTSGYTELRPLQSNVTYCLDMDQKRALWVSTDLKTDEWNKQFFPAPKIDKLKEFYPDYESTFLQNDAPVIDVTTPGLKILEDRTEKGKRVLHFNLKSTRNANFMRMLFHKVAGITRMKIDGKAIENNGFYSDLETGYYSLVYYAVPVEGIDVEIEINGEKKIELVAVEGAFGLPEFPQYKPKPRNVIPGAGFFGNTTVLKKAYIL